MKHARSLAASALQSAHRVAEGAMEVQRHPALNRAQYSGGQIADAGVSALAHLACAAVSIAGGRSTEAARADFARAEAHLEKLRTLLRACESQGFLGRMELMPLYYAIDETVELARRAASEAESARASAA